MTRIIAFAVANLLLRGAHAGDDRRREYPSRPARLDRMENARSPPKAEVTAVPDYPQCIITQKGTEVIAVEVQGTRYGLQTKLGQGNFGTVWSTKSSGSSREGEKVIKVFNTSSTVANIRREHAAMQRLGKYCDMGFPRDGSSSNTGVLVMDRVPGKPLDQILATQELEDTDIKTIIDLTEVRINEIHKLGIIHQDIKPDNIMVEQDADNRIVSVHLIDYGWAAKMIGDDDVSRSRYDPLHYQMIGGECCHMGPKLTLESVTYQQGKPTPTVRRLCKKFADLLYRYENDDFWQLGLVAFKLMTNKWMQRNNFWNVVNLFTLQPSELVSEDRREWQTIIAMDLPEIKWKMVVWMHLETFNPELAKLLDPQQLSELSLSEA